MEVVRVKGQVQMGSYLMGVKFQFGKMNTLEMNGGDVNI
jgi:hypothetical protein